MKEHDELAGIIEKEVKKSNLVDLALPELAQIEKNAPLNQLDRREFLFYGAETVGKFIASLAGLGLLSQSTSSCAPIGATIRTAAEKNWELYLLKQDWIRGPRVLIHPSTGLPSDFQHHIRQGWSGGFGASDYDVPIGTPIVPTANAFRTRTNYDRTGGNQLTLIHRYKSGFVMISWYVHLDGYSDIIPKGKLNRMEGATEVRDQELNKLKIIAFSGNTGVGPGGGVQPQHLHFQITEAGTYPGGYPIAPGLEPFELGIDADKKIGEYGGRPVYWNGRTAIIHTPSGREKWLQRSMDNLERKVKQSSLDKETKDEILKRSDNPIALRDYLGMRVLQKKRDEKGNFNYEFKPDSFMYALMLEFYGRTSKQDFIAMLPFPYPGLKHIYQKANSPNVQL